MEIISIEKNPELAGKKLKQALETGKIIIYPTDTCYGIGGNGLDKKVVEKIYKIKKRKRNNPVSVIIGDISLAEKFCIISPSERKKLKKYIPGPYTILLRRNKKRIPVGDKIRLGIRIPKYPFLQNIMRNMEIPLITTSANISGDLKSPTKIDEISKEVLKKADIVLDGGETKYKYPSTIIDLPTGRVLRDFITQRKV
ncbi:MAG: L-threonylcarbamoyladenylate synthase [Candidatus Micrarchaeia archaeon]